MNKTTFYSIVFLLVFALQGCLDSSESEFERQVREDNEAIQAWLAANNIDAERTSSGVHVEVLNENEDGTEVEEDHILGILYTMTHLAGEYVVETHTDHQNPVRFLHSERVNDNPLIPAGLNYEIGRMKEGETFRFYIPSYQAFWEYAHEDFFDEFSNFIMEVELAEVNTEEEIHEEELEIIQNYIAENGIEAEERPDGLYYVQTEEGAGEHPGSSDLVEFHFTRKYLDGTIITTTTGGEPVLGHMNNLSLVQGLKDGLQLMREGEKATLILPSKIAFGASVQVIPVKLREELVEDENVTSIPAVKPYTPVLYEIELLRVN